MERLFEDYMWKPDPNYMAVRIDGELPCLQSSIYNLFKNGQPATSWPLPIPQQVARLSKKKPSLNSQGPKIKRQQKEYSDSFDISSKMALHVSRQLDQTCELLDSDQNDWYQKMDIANGHLRHYKRELDSMRNALDSVVIGIKREHLHGLRGDWREKIDKIDLIDIQNQVTRINRQIENKGGAVQIGRNALLAAGVELASTSTSSRDCLAKAVLSCLLRLAEHRAAIGQWSVPPSDEVLCTLSGSDGRPEPSIALANGYLRRYGLELKGQSDGRSLVKTFNRDDGSYVLGLNMGVVVDGFEEPNDHFMSLLAGVTSPSHPGCAGLLCDSTPHTPKLLLRADDKADRGGAKRAVQRMYSKLCVVKPVLKSVHKLQPIGETRQEAKRSKNCARRKRKREQEQELKREHEHKRGHEGGYQNGGQGGGR